MKNAIKFASDDGVVTYEEIRQNLKKYYVKTAIILVWTFTYLFFNLEIFRCNFSEMEIEMFFCRYDVDGDVKLDVTETYKILNDINYGRLDYGGKIINGDQDQGPTTATAEEYHMYSKIIKNIKFFDSISFCNLQQFFMKLFLLLGLTVV